MSTYAVEQILKGQFTREAVNAQIDALNLTYGLSGASAVPGVAKVYTDDLISDTMVLDTPAVAVYTGTAVAAAGQPKQHGYRSFDIPVVIGYAPRSSDPERARRETGVTLEALLAIVEKLLGQQLGATNRAIQHVKDIAYDTVRLTVEGSPVAYGGSLAFTVVCVTRGLT